MPRLRTERRLAIVAGGLIAVTLIAFTALATNVAAQTPTGTAAPPKATATATPAAPTAAPAATTPAAAKATATATAAAAPKAVAAADNTMMYVYIAIGAIVIIGGAWYVMRRRS